MRFLSSPAFRSLQQPYPHFILPRQPERSLQRRLLQLKPNFPTSAIELINGMLDYDPLRRITASAALDHGFFKEFTPRPDSAQLNTKSALRLLIFSSPLSAVSSTPPTPASTRIVPLPLPSARTPCLAASEASVFLRSPPLRGTLTLVQEMCKFGSPLSIRRAPPDAVASARRVPAALIGHVGRAT